MAEHTGENRKDQATAFSDEAIRRFLLGSLGGDEQAGFEESLLTDDALEERVRTAEYELADDYAFSWLSTPERELFEKKFLVTLDRKRKLQASAALQNHLAAQAVSKESAPSRTDIDTHEKILGWFGFHRPALGFAIAFALLVLFSGVVWLALKSKRVNDPAIAKREPVVTATPETTPEIRRAPSSSPTPEVTASPNPTPKTAPTPAEPASTSVVATFLLLPNALRDGGQMTHVAIRKGAKGEQGIVRLQLALEVDEPGSHSAELLTAEGIPVYAGHKLKTNNAGSNAGVVFDVPARLLKSGDYQVKLNWIVGGSVTSGGRYYFRVTP